MFCGKFSPQLWLLIAAVVHVQAVYDRAYSGIKTKTYHHDSQYASTLDDQYSQPAAQQQQQQQQQYQPHSHYSSSQNYDSAPGYHVSSYGSSSGRLSTQQQHYGGSGGISGVAHTYSAATQRNDLSQQQQQQSQGDYYRHREIPVYDRAARARPIAALQQSSTWSANLDEHTGCPPQHTGPVPYAYDCRRFVNCWHGRGHIQSCGPGTVFNPETLECDRPDKVDCGVLGAEGGTLSAQRAVLQSSANTAKYRAGRLLDVSTDKVNSLCPHGATGLHPHPTDCTKFLTCGNGNVHVQDCGPGTAFSVSMLACDYKDKVDCGGRQGHTYGGTYTHGSQQSVGIVCPAGAVGLYPHPFDCTKFLNCAHSETVVQNCGPGTAFDRVRLLCDYKDKVNCATAPGHEQQIKGGYTDKHEEEGNIFCPIGVTGLFPYPFDYTRFINCKKGNTAIQNCMPGTVYSISRGNCDLKDNVMYNDHVTYIVSEVSYEYSLTVASCPPSTDGVHLYPYDCTKYIICNNGHMTIENCTPNTIYSITGRTCLPKANVNTKDHVKYQTDILHSTANMITQANNKEMLQCPHGSSRMSMFPHPFDCTKYLQCLNGRLSVEFCTSGTVFSLSNKRCEPKENLAVTDKVRSIFEYGAEWTGTMKFDYTNFDEGTVYLMCPQDINGLFLYPFDCTKYLNCHNGESHVESCASGAVFSISKQKCVSRNQVEAYDRVEYLTETKHEFSTETGQLNNQYDVKCPYGVTGLYPHPRDCSKYLKCANGYTFVESCAPGMVFSISRRYCDYEERVLEYDRGNYGYKGSSGKALDYGSNVHTVEGSSNSEETFSQNSDTEVSCPPRAEGMYPHPEDCRKFVTCSHGQTYVKNCGPGTAWSAEMEVCDFEHKVNCNGRSLGGGSSGGFNVQNSVQKWSADQSMERVACPPAIYGHYLHPFDAHKYLSCQHGETTVETCSPRTVFSISQGVCAPEQQVNAVDRVLCIHETITDATVTVSGQYGYVTCPPGANGLYIYPFDCARFIRCGGGHTKIETCQPRSIFSKSQRMCVPEADVERSDRVSYWRDVQTHTASSYGDHRQSTGKTSTWSSTNTEAVSHSNQGATPSCPAGLTGLSPHPYDCTKFLNCANGIAYIQDCGPGTGFNPKLLVCDFLEKVDCGHSFAESASREGKGLSHAGKVTCPEDATGLYPHPYDCTKFLNCAHGVANIQDCGPGTAWSPKLEVCDFIANVDCSDHLSSSHTRTDTFTDYNNRGSKSYGYGGAQSNQWGYDAHSGHNQLVPGGQTSNQAHGTGVSSSGSSVYEDRWSNMNRRRPVGYDSSTAQSIPSSSYGGHQQTSIYGGASRYNTESDTWSGSGSAVDYHTPTQHVIYEEGSLEPNRNYNTFKTYTAPLAPLGPDLVAAATNDINSNKHTLTSAPVIPHTSTTNIYYAQPVGSDEDSEEAFDNVARGHGNYSNISNSRENKWIPIPNHNLMPPLPSDKQHSNNQPNAIEHSQQKPLYPNIPVTHLMPPLPEKPTKADEAQRGSVEPYVPYNPSDSPPYDSAQSPAITGTLSKNPINYPHNSQPPYPQPSVSPFKPSSTQLTPPMPSSTNQIPLEETYPPAPVVDASNLYGGMLPPLPLIPTTTPVPHTRHITTPATYILPPTPPTPPMQPRPSDTTRLSRVHPTYTYPLIANTTTQNFSKDPHYSPPYSSVSHSRNPAWSKPTNNIQPIKTSHPTVSHLPQNPEVSENGEEVDKLLIGDALRLMLRPYFNRSGTVPEDTAIKAEGHIMQLIPQSPQAPDQTASSSDKITPTTTERTSVDVENEADVELILAGEQHSLTTIPIRNGTHETRTDFYSQHNQERSDVNTNWHAHEHSREYHSRHPNLPNPFTTDQTSQTNLNVPQHQHHHHPHTHHTHSKEFHLHHPELPNPFATAPSEGDEAAVITLLPNPNAEATTPSSANPRIDLRGFNSDCQFDCGNGNCVQSFEVCDGVNNCGNRKDEKQCDHLGYEVRLTSGESSNMGRLEVKILGKWGYVCDDKFGLRDADVACRELGFNLGASEVRGNSYYPPTAMDVSFAMDEVNCLGNETSLRECEFKGWGVSNCGPDEVVGVVCKVAQFKCPNNYWLCSTSKECIPPAFVCDNTPDCADNSDEADNVCNSPVEYRLVGGRSSNEGRLEVKYRGEWGTVCDDDFSLKEAQVLCNSMGLYGKPRIEKNKFGGGGGPIWLDQVSCFGNETSLDKCHHWTWGEHNCNHAEDVGLKCTSGAPPHRTSSTDVQTQFEEVDVQQQIEDNQRLLEDIGLYSGQWERNSKAIGSQRRCGKFKNNLIDEYAHPEERVVNGTVAKRGHHPWQATIRTKGRGGISSHWCGAVLISSKHLLTAAHCLAGYPKGAYFVRMGDHYANIAESSEIDSFIENWYTHENFRDQTHMNNDIALVVLKTPVKFNDYIQPVCLPEKGASLEENRMCTISGWGSIKSGVSTPSNILRAAQLPILSDAVCKQTHVYGASMTEGMFCAGFMDESVDACDGDSGGPLICHDDDGETLYGIISWGQHCGYANKPGVYVRVEKYVDWILDKINTSMQNA